MVSFGAGGGVICYKDETFCNAVCGNEKCVRKLTDEVKRKAEAWWGKQGAPISVDDFSEDCNEVKEVKV